MLPLYPGAEPCVGSGMCCKKGPCAFGTAKRQEDPGCVHLVAIPQGPDRATRYTCGIYAEIIQRPGWEHNPAFGAGCCMSLFNANRQQILKEMHDDEFHSGR
jgi:hypothetical protein